MVGAGGPSLDPRPRHAEGMRVRDFYDDPDRADSDEVDFGSQWRTQGDGPWKVVWLAATGEIAAFNSGRSGGAVMPGRGLGLGALLGGGGPDEVVILGAHPDLDTVRAGLTGWQDHMAEDNGLAWLAERIDELPEPEPEPPESEPEPEAEADGEKLVFVFGRKPGLSFDEFARHYLDVHAPLGLRVTRAMQRYVVNLADVDGPPQPFPVDAITEIWTPSADDFFDPSRAFTSPEDGNALLADHATFIGPMHAYEVEERVVTDGPSTDVKYVALAPAPVTTEATRHVENRVVRTLTPDAPPVDVFTLLHFPDRDAALAYAGTTSGFFVTEHVQKA
jgi:uncharacterized protein (TIGR02118 family)